MKSIQPITVINTLLGLSVFSIFLWPLIPPILWATIFIYWLYTNGFPKSWKPLTENPYFILFALLYVVHVIGMLWTADVAYGLRDLRIKIPMLLFPLFFPYFSADKRTAAIVKRAFILGNILACLICFFNALIKYFISGNSSAFFYSEYSILVFPGYFSMGLNLAALLSLEMVFFDTDNSFTKNKILLYIITFIFLLNIIQLSEKMSMISTVITIPFYLITEAHKRKILRSIFIKLSLGFLVFIFIFLGYLKIFNRFSQVTDALKTFNSASGPQPESYYNSSTIRLTEWKYGYEIFKRNWLCGVGTGDIKSETLASYRRDNFEYGIKHFETPASQYLHLAMILGVIGLCVLLACYFLPFLSAVKEANYLFATFLLIFIINSVTGTVLSASGVLLYGFFNSFFYKVSINKNSRREHYN